MTEYVWHPLSPSQAAAIFDPLQIQWWIAGGVAIDLFAGRTTRAHGDLDIAMLRSDTAALVPLLGDWDIHIAHDGVLTPWDGAPFADEVHQFWVRPRGADVWAYEILLEYTDGGDWLYRRDTRARKPIDDIGRHTEVGIPYLAPEICLLYKSPRNDVERHQADFVTAAPLLDALALTWLREVLQMLNSHHPWLTVLADSDAGSLAER